LPFIVEKRNEVEGGMTAFRGHENLLSWQSYDLSVGNKTLKDNIEYAESIYRDNFRFLNSSLGHNILILYMSENITDENNCYGSKPIGAVNGSTINYYYDNTAIDLGSDDLRLDAYAPFHNIISFRVDVVQGRKTIIWEPLFI